MSYQPLARKYRPQLFADLVGQDAVALALANAIQRQAPPPVILFTGIRGVGKTTVARLYAKALNCEERGSDAEPCNACASCVAIARGAHEDVIEIDGASNTGVGDVRALQETLEYVPQRKKYKVYIIDEVHMLSQAAFNALLKTLEEPRPHVVFIFATTEVHKVPQTILSRCQTFYLKKLPLALIRDRLASILQKEAIAADPKALSIVAREGHGSMRDALTMLDQTIALGAGQVTMAALGPIVSNLSSSSYLEILAALVQRDAAAALTVIEQLDEGGADFVAVAEELAGFARHAFVLRDLGSQALDAALLGLDDAELDRLSQIAQSAAAFDLNRIFRTLVQCRSELDGSALDRYVLENYIFEWCLDPGLPDIDSLLASQLTGSSTRSQMTAQIKAPVATQATAQVATQATAQKKLQMPPTPQLTPPAAAAPLSSATLSSAPPSIPSSHVTSSHATSSHVSGAAAATPSERGILPETWRQLVDAWKREKPFQARKLEEVHPIAYSANAITLAVSEDSYASKVLLQLEEQTRIRDQFRDLFGFTGTFNVVSSKQAMKNAQQAPSMAGSDPMIRQVPADAAELPPEVPVEPAMHTSKPAPSRAAATATASSDGEVALPDTILTERGREATERREKLIHEARNAAFTQELLQELGGRIEDIRLLGDVDPS